eukprot:363391-Chlamydomonas_euryale.AAC.11
MESLVSWSRKTNAGSPLSWKAGHGALPAHHAALLETRLNIEGRRRKVCGGRRDEEGTRKVCGGRRDVLQSTVDVCVCVCVWVCVDAWMCVEVCELMCIAHLLCPCFPHGCEACTRTEFRWVG